MVLWGYVILKTSDITWFIVRSAIKAHNFKVWPALVTITEINHLGGHLIENPNMHYNILVKCDTIELNRCPWMLLGWSTSHCLWRIEPTIGCRIRNSATWIVLSKAFLSKCLPSGKTAKLRANITSLLNEMGSPYMALGENLRIFSDSAIIMVFLDPSQNILYRTRPTSQDFSRYHDRRCSHKKIYRNSVDFVRGVNNDH